MLTELGRGVLFRVHGLGQLVHTSEDDAAAPRLRELWRFARGTSVDVAGAIDGMPALLVREISGCSRHAARV